MKIHKRAACLSLLVLLCWSISLHGQAEEDKDIQASCRSFVQGFYDWYARMAVETTSKVIPLDRALEIKGNDFSVELVRQLKELSEVQTKDHEVWLGFDPFLDTQDPAETYAVGDIEQRGHSYWVGVYEVRSGKKSEKPIVVPEVILKGGNWVFVNFHYPNHTLSSKNEDLLSVLKRIRETWRKQSINSGH